MAMDPTQIQQAVVADPPASAVPANAVPSSPMADDALPEGMKRDQHGNVQVLSSQAYKRLKEQAFSKGKNAALLDLAKSQGFSSTDEMHAFLSGRKAGGGNGHPKPGNGQQKPKPKPQVRADGEEPTSPANNRRDHAAIESAKKREAQAHRRAQDALAEARRERRQREVVEVERELERVAHRVGIKDTDYAIRLFNRALAGETDEAKLRAFDEEKFFVGLRDNHPYLFGEVVKTATTGTAGGGAPPAPTPGAAAKGAAQGQQIDARKMTPEEYRVHLKKRGLSVSG